MKFNKIPYKTLVSFRHWASNTGTNEEAQSAPVAQNVIERSEVRKNENRRQRLLVHRPNMRVKIIKTQIAVLQWQLLRHKYATGCGNSGLKHLRPTGKQQSGGVRGTEGTYKYHTKWKEPEEIKHSSSTEIKMEKERNRQGKRIRKSKLQEGDIKQDKKKNLNFLQRWEWRLRSCGMWRRALRHLSTKSHGFTS